MTAAKKKAQRAPDEGEPDSGKLPEGTHGEPRPDPEPLSDLNPENEPEDVPEVVVPDPPVTPEVKSHASAQPSLLARFARWWASDLDGN